MQDKVEDVNSTPKHFIQLSIFIAETKSDAVAMSRSKSQIIHSQD
jgi:hypothetical protein